jgi:hypothetical protein
MDKIIPRSEYNSGQFAVYIPPSSPSERNLCIIDHKKYSLDARNNQFKWFYSGRILKIRQTKDGALPLVPVFKCGLYFAPEECFRSLETFL